MAFFGFALPVISQVRDPAILIDAITDLESLNVANSESGQWPPGQDKANIRLLITMTESHLSVSSASDSRAPAEAEATAQVRRTAQFR